MQVKSSWRGFSAPAFALSACVCGALQALGRGPEVGCREGGASRNNFLRGDLSCGLLYFFSFACSRGFCSIHVLEMGEPIRSNFLV
jgi:hypothetical protein